MRQLIRRREIVSDDWRYADEDPQGRDRALILPFARWQQERNRWWLWDGRLGVQAAVRNLLGADLRYHPAGATFAPTAVVGGEARLP